MLRTTEINGVFCLVCSCGQSLPHDSSESVESWQDRSRPFIDAHRGCPNPEPPMPEPTQDERTQAAIRLLKDRGLIPESFNPRTQTLEGVLRPMTSFVLPVIKNMSPAPVLELESVQPMTEPPSGTFYMDIVSSDRGPQLYEDMPMNEADPAHKDYAEMVETFTGHECNPVGLNHGHPLPKVAKGETLHGYHYGGIMAERAGVYVTPTDEPRRILRYKGLWMS